MRAACQRYQNLLPLLVAVCVTVATLPCVEAMGRGGGHIERGGHGGGGGFHGGGGGPRGGGMHLNNANADARTRNVRNTSVNNVNVNVNANDHGDHGHDHGYDHHGGWDDDYHPIATAAAVTATVAVTSAVVGSIVRSVPPDCAPVNYGGMIYQRCGSTWYQPQGSQYVVVNAPY